MIFVSRWIITSDWTILGTRTWSIRGGVWSCVSWAKGRNFIISFRQISFKKLDHFEEMYFLDIKWVSFWSLFVHSYIRNCQHRPIKAGEEIFTHYGYKKGLPPPSDYPWYWELLNKIEEEEKLQKEEKEKLHEET